MRLAARAARLTESATLKVARMAKELEAQGVDVLDLSAGEPDFPSPACAVEEAKRALDRGLTRYTAAAGLPELRSALAARYQKEHGAPWGAADVAVTVGAKAALLELALALCDGGGEVVIPAPCWVTLPEQVRLAGGEVVLVPTSHADGFRMKAADVLAAVGAATRGVILNSPCNPTGGILEAGDLEAIVAECAARGLWVIADETYDRFVFDGRRHASIAALAARYPETAILVGSFSKTYSMTGWRIGYALGPKWAMQPLMSIQSHATSNATSFAMAGAVAALERGEDGVREMVAEFESRRDLVAERLAAMPGVECAPPAGAFYAFPRVEACYGPGRGDSIALAEELLERARVAVVPGEAFGDDRHVRLSFACDRSTLERALDRMAEVLAAPQ